jgi:hemolysin activation/secretion protein/AraC-like DNA-binding protein
MALERHLILQEITLRPSGEWTPPAPGWTVVRVAEGMGYWLQGGGARELKAGDGFAATETAHLVLRASQLGPLKLEFFCVQPQFLNGLITVSEGHQLMQAGKNTAARAIAFHGTDPVGQKFSRLVAQPQRENLTMRSALLQLWSQAVSGMLSAPPAEDHSHKLHERFAQLVAQMPDAELATRSLTELAAQLHCSERHFSRLFRAEFGVPLRKRQTELRLQRARQLLADANAKIINVAYESGYRHLGLFNAMFKKRFGVTPSEWRQQNLSLQPKNYFKRTGPALGLALLLAAIFISPRLLAETVAAAAEKTASATNAAPKFTVEKYLVSGNSVLPLPALGKIFKDTPAAFGTNVTFPDIRTALGELQMAYRERGFVTVSVALPPQKLTNATVKINVTEGRLSAITVKGNDWFSTPNVLRALPSLHTNLLLNSHVFQRELDGANANRNRQIYPVISPGLEPGTSEITLKVKDQFPLHGRVEINNQATPGTPESRINASAQYDNLWQLEHQLGLNYSFSGLAYKNHDEATATPLDLPAIANLSGYYRLPLGPQASVQSQIDASGGTFGYSEITHQFRLPPPTGRPELTFFANRSSTDTGVVYGQRTNIITTPLLTIDRQDAGDNVSLNEGIGAKVSLPLPMVGNLASTLMAGFDFKRYQNASFNTNIFSATTYITNSDGSVQRISSTVPSGQPTRYAEVDYFPINLGLVSTLPDAWGGTTFNVQANYNLGVSGGHLGSAVFRSGTNTVALPGLAYSTNAPNRYFSVTAGLAREQRLYKDWTMLLRADGQWTDKPLFSNEQFAMGGTAGGRGYSDGVAYGDTGWRVSIEPRTPLVNIGMVDGDVPFWVRASVFLDYGEISLVDGSYARTASQEGPTTGHVAGNPSRLDFLGTGWSLTGNIGSHLDMRLTMAFPLINNGGQPGWSPAHDLHIYFGVGAQF